MSCFTVCGSVILKVKFLGACSAFSFLGVCLEAGLVNLLLCYKCILKCILPTKDYRQSTAGWLGNLNTFCICFFPSLFSLWCYDGPITDWSLVCMSFWIQLSPNRIDLSARFTSKYIKNAHFVFLPLRKGNQRTTDMPVPPLFSFSYSSEIQAHGKWQIQDLSPSFLGCTWAHFFQGMTSTNSLPSPLRQNYAAATPNIIPSNPARREGAWETAGRWDIPV